MKGAILGPVIYNFFQSPSGLQTPRFSLGDGEGGGVLGLPNPGRRGKGSSFGQFLPPGLFSE